MISGGSVPGFTAAFFYRSSFKDGKELSLRVMPPVKEQRSIPRKIEQQ